MYKFFNRDPELLTAVVDDLVLVRVTVDGVSAGGGVEEIGEEVRYWYLCKNEGCVWFGGGRRDGGDASFDNW